MKSNILRAILSIIIVFIFSLSSSLVGAATPCTCDFDHDGDVDGSDLTYLISSGGINLESFASQFGRSDCALEARITLSPMALKRTAIQGGPNPDPGLQSFSVQNTGNTTLEYSIACDADWFYVSPDAGILNSGETDTIPVLYEVVTPVLDPGIYHTTITVSGTMSLTGEPIPDRTLGVTLTVISSDAELIIDNDDPGTSLSGGAWGYSNGVNYYGSQSRAETEDGAAYTFEGMIAGYLDISLWWTWWESRCGAVPVDIYDGNTLLATVEVNQQQADLAGKWNFLGSYPFSGPVRVILRAQSTCSTCADAVKFEHITSDPFVVLTEPQSYYLQTFPDLYVFAASGNLEAGWGVKFITDKDTVDERIINDYTVPYEGVFTGLMQIEHTLDAYVIDGSGNTVSGSFTHDQKVQIGIGQYYVAIGDSITEGFGDNDPSDDVSLDGRNTGGGYEPILNDLLTGFLGIPHTVVNEGVGGTTSADGLESINTIIANHPLSRRFLIEYGTNDARPWLLPVPSGLGLNPEDSGYLGSFKDNMQQIIDALNTASKEAFLAKAPITLGDSTDSTPYEDPDLGARSVLVKEFNQVIDELAGDPSNNILVVPPDFYGLFNEDVLGGKRYDSEYADNLHPNGEGCRSMADEWENVLIP